MSDHRQMMVDPPALEFVEIVGGEHELGWRFDHVLAAETRNALAAFTNDVDFREFYFSPRRSVFVASFAIATTSIDWENLFDWDEFGSEWDEISDSIDELSDFGAWLDACLAGHGWRLPTQDEFEVACGGELFAWGNDIPAGIPIGQYTEFVGHRQPNARGLSLNADTYRCEITRDALKLGDGGEAVCGGYPWPIAWLSFCPAYRVPQEVLSGAKFEMLEHGQVRPVLLQ